MIYRRRASPLHAARASVACSWCLALTLASLLVSDPVLLGAVVAAILAGAAAAGVGRGVARAGVLLAPVAVAIMLINALVTRDGLTVILRLGDLPVLGHTDVTLEATVYGGVLGLRATALVLCGALYTLAVDPDEVLRLFRRVSYRSALSATLATRMIPVLIRDGRRLADAQRCRPGPPPSRVALMRAVSTGALDRALDVAAALEVRGYAAARRPSAHRAPWSRHDVAFMTSAVAILAVVVWARTTGVAAFSAYPGLSLAPVLPTLGVCVLLLVVALAPFTDRRGIHR